MRVGFVEQQDVDLGIGGEGEDAQPLQKAAALDHQIACVVAAVTLELEAVDGAFDHLDLDVGVVLLAERRDVEFGAEGGAQVLLQQLPGVRAAQAAEVGVADLALRPAEPLALGEVALLHVE